MKHLLANLWLNRAKARNLKLYVLGCTIGRGGVISPDLEEALDDNLATDVGCVERIYG